MRSDVLYLETASKRYEISWLSDSQKHEKSVAKAKVDRSKIEMKKELSSLYNENRFFFNLEHGDSFLAPITVLISQKYTIYLRPFEPCFTSD